MKLIEIDLTQFEYKFSIISIIPHIPLLSHISQVKILLAFIFHSF